MQISLVIPLLNEEESLRELHDWIVSVMNENSYTYEILFIDDGSTDNSWNLIEALQKENAHVKGLRFSKNFGKSQALNAGFKQVEGDVIITMDADLQDAPDEIPALYKKITSENFDLVSGWKKKRYDSKIKKNLPSKLFNWAARKTSGIQLNDFNCGLKAYDKKVVKSIDVQGEMHRYIPVLAKNAGFIKIGEQVVKHQARKYGETKFGMERFVNGFLDLLTIWFVSKFGKRPMHLFGLLGTLMFLIGFMAAFYIGTSKLLSVFVYNEPSPLVTDSPWFYIALTTMVLGTQLFLAGFIGELILRSKKNIANYQISKEI
ncbi:glycosyltransferase family 2 protein [Flavicella sp.]|uniref:glycosyltransferase family 2 protein n=1 Tax=Flavicella sp. TaxID=2957742 RepID=UPI002621AF72|nr:glycosyltransferase family 2 protein [Flavicella sp.]MDG1804383.1 glycosyltransferase family 2 protein [Flavicella sp.]